MCFRDLKTRVHEWMAITDQFVFYDPDLLYQHCRSNQKNMNEARNILSVPYQCIDIKYLSSSNMKIYHIPIKYN